MRSASVMPVVDREPLELVEDRIPRRGDVVPAVDAADRDHVDRRPLALHLVDLRGRGLRAEQGLLVEIERVARRARRMPVREAERVEVVARRLDLAAVDDLVAEAEEDVLDVAAHERRRMQRAARTELRRPEQLGRQRHVDALGREPLLELGTRQILLAGGQRRLDGLAHGVQRHPGLAVAHLAERELQCTLTAEEADPDLGQRGERPRLGCRGQRLLLEVVGIHVGDLIQRFLLLSRARERGRSRPGSFCGGDDAR